MRFTKTFKVYSLAILFLMAGSVGSAFAQENEKANEIGLLLSGVSTSSRDLRPQTAGRADIGTGLTFIATYGRRIVGGDKAGLIAEVIFTATPSTDVKSTNLTLPRNYASLFIAPGLKLKFFPHAVLSPYVAAGGGYARFTESDFRIDNRPNTGNTGTNTGAFNFGGGIELRVLKFLAVRGEGRDFFTGAPNFNFPVSGDWQHNVIVSGGIVLRL
jgi:hypothetical protein